jgi:hypothetical protein
MHDPTNAYHHGRRQGVMNRLADTQRVASRIEWSECEGEIQSDRFRTKAKGRNLFLAIPAIASERAPEVRKLRKLARKHRSP